MKLLIKSLFIKIIRIFNNNYNKVLIWKCSTNFLPEKVVEKYDIRPVTSYLVDMTKLNAEVDKNCRYHPKFPRYCINSYGLKRKVYIEDSTDFLYYREKGKKYYLQWQ